MAYQRLTGIDTVFFLAESETTPLHMLAAIILDPSTVPGGYSFEKIRDFLADRMHLIPPMQRRIAHVPFGLAPPVWVENVEVDLDLHIRRAALPRPGGPEELCNLAAELFTHRLDSSRPMWEIVVVEGLENDRIAILAKLHHSLMDGTGGMQYMGSFFSNRPELTKVKKADDSKARRTGKPPSNLRLWAGAAASLLDQPRRAVVAGRSALEASVRFARARFEEGGDGEDGGLTVPKTILNQMVGKHRAVAYTSLPIERLKAVARASDATLNDVLLALVGATLRAYLIRHGALPDGPLVAAVPISIRDAEGMEDLTNAVSVLFAGLGTDIDDPVARLHSISSSTRQGKDRQKRFGANIMKEITEVPAPLVISLAMRAVSSFELFDKMPPICNAVISNVPGPPIDLYFAGARIEDIYPLGPVYDGVCLNITALSNRERVDLGLVADRKAVPDLWDIARGLEESFAELEEKVLPNEPMSEVTGDHPEA